MKVAITIIAALCLCGCSTLQKAMVITQEIQGSGSLTVESPVQVTAIVVENARQEGPQFKADKLDITHRGKWLGEKIDLHLEDYSRPIIIRKAAE